MEKLLEEFGIKPNNRDYYEIAFTHSSYATKINSNDDYERLEFLGDSALNMLVSLYLYKMHPEFGEGKLTKIRANYVCQQALIFYSHRYGLDKYVKVNLEDKRITENEVISITADVFESFIGAIYLDKGIDQVDDFLKQTVYPYIRQKRVFFYDYKSTLKEYGDAEEVSVEYEVMKEYGLPHDKTFIIKVNVDGKKLGVGKGKNKKDAEQEAAKKALYELGVEG